MTGTIHHCFPYHPAHLGLSSEHWIDSQITRWPLAAVAKTDNAPRTTVHFFADKPLTTHAPSPTGLRFVAHRAPRSGPRWREWGDDWAPSLGRLAANLTPDDLCVIHLDSVYAAAKLHSLASHSRVAVVLHGKGFHGAHIRAADAVVALRQFTGQSLLAEGLPADRLLVTRPSVNTSLFAPRTAAPAPTPLRLGFVGMLVSYKGVTQLIETVNLLRQRQIPFTLDVVGAGRPDEVQSILQQLRPTGSETDVRYLDQQPSAKVAALMAQWDLLLHPSHTEGMPIVILEALSVGLPIVAVRDVLPAEMECCPGVHLTARDDYAAHVADHHAAMSRTPVDRSLVLSHDQAADLWDTLAAITRRNAAVPRSSETARAWRLKPLRSWIHQRPALRTAIRRARASLGPLSGLHSAHA